MLCQYDRFKSIYGEREYDTVTDLDTRPLRWIHSSLEKGRGENKIRKIKKQQALMWNHPQEV